MVVLATLVVSAVGVGRVVGVVGRGGEHAGVRAGAGDWSGEALAVVGGGGLLLGLGVAVVIGR